MTKQLVASRMFDLWLQEWCLMIYGYTYPHWNHLKRKAAAEAIAVE